MAEQVNIEQYLSVNEAAKALDVCQPTIRKMIAQGKLAAYRLTPGGHFRIRVSEFNRLAKQLENGEAAEPASTASDLESLLS